MPGLKHQGSPALGSQKDCLCLPRLLLHYFWQGQQLRKFYQILGLGKDKGRTDLTVCREQLDKNLSNGLWCSCFCKVWVLRGWSSTWRALGLSFFLRGTIVRVRQVRRNTNRAVRCGMRKYKEAVGQWIHLIPETKSSESQWRDPRDFVGYLYVEI